MKRLLLCLVLLEIAICSLKAQVITTYAGNGTGAYAGDGGQATLASIRSPYPTVFDKSGNLYIADYQNFRIRKVTPAGVITTVAGNGVGAYSGDGGPATSASLYYPSGVTLDSAGNLYIGDAGNMVVRKVDKNGTITTIAGNHTGGYNGDGIPGTQAELDKPSDLAFDKAGNLYILDIANNRIRKLSPAGIITTVAGDGAQGYSGDGGPALNAELNRPGGLTLDKDGNIFIADFANMRIRKVTVSTGIITTIAGTGVQGYSGDGGQATSAKLYAPTGLIFDASGNLYISDDGNNVVRKINTAGIITTIAGTGVASYSGDGAPAVSATLNQPLGLTFDASGNLYISDLGNNRIRKVAFASPPTITSFSPTSGGAGSAIVITGTNFTGASAVSFGGVAASSFTVNSATKITAKVASGGATGSVSVTTPSGTATHNGFTFCLTPSIKIKANATSPICQGTWITFTATPVNGGTAPTYQWQKNKVNVGTNSTTYMDSALQNTDTITCVLTSNATSCLATNNVSSNGISFTVNPKLTPSVSITANPGNWVCAGTKITFTAAPVNGGSTPVYQWKMNNANVGTNSTTYTDTLPKNGDSVSITLTSNAACVANNPVSSYVIVTVNTPQPVIMINANKDTTICSSTKVTFTATVTPFYLWKKNGSSVGANSNIYVDSMLKNGDNIQCFLVSNVTACNNVASNIINSNKLKFTVNNPPTLPSAIVGPSTVKPGQGGYYFSVTQLAGVTYAWTLPEGAKIDSGQGGNKIKVTWGSVAGNVSVIAINSCGSSPVRSKAVTAPAGIVANSSVESVGKSTMTDNEVYIYPNPASAWTSIVFVAKTQEKYVVTIADAQNKVLEIRNGLSVTGKNTIRINTAKYAKGTYFITVIDKENGQRNKELVVGQ